MFLVIILGGFHLMMSYMESVGTLMKGSGLEEALTTCYGSNTVENMITGKAGEGYADIFIVERALQEAAHSIVDVLAQDINILIILIHHWDNSKNDFFFNTEKRQNSTKVNKWWNIECFKEGDASDWMDDILFSHAWDDCDTASAIHQRLVTLHIS